MAIDIAHFVLCLINDVPFCRNYGYSIHFTFSKTLWLALTLMSKTILLVIGCQIYNCNSRSEKFIDWNKRSIKIITWYISISDLTNLVELDLSYNFLSSIPVGALADLNNLKFLNLGSNKIQVKFWNLKHICIAFLLAS